MTERNANHIILLYCHLPVSCRSLVDRCGSLGSCEPQIYFYTHKPKCIYKQFSIRSRLTCPLFIYMFLFPSTSMAPYHGITLHCRKIPQQSQESNPGTLRQSVTTLTLRQAINKQSNGAWKHLIVVAVGVLIF